MGGFGVTKLPQKKYRNQNARAALSPVKVDAETFWSSQKSSQLVRWG